MTQPGVAGRVLLAFVAFCLVSSAMYLFNDLGDVSTAATPVKSARPIASGARRVAARAAIA